MPPKPPVFQKCLSWAYRNYSQDVGKSLIHLGAVGWVLSSLAQTTMLITNKDIDKKEKKFLVPQEIADGVVNVGLYYTVSELIKRGAERLVENGKLLPAGVHNAILEMAGDKQTVSNHVRGIGEKLDAKNIGKKGENISRFINLSTDELNNVEIRGNRVKITTKDNIIFNKFNTIKDKKQYNNLVNLAKNAKEEFAGFKNGVGVIAAVGASVIACNILTPILRNAIGNKVQKKQLEKTKQSAVEIQKPENKINTNKILIKPYVHPISNTYNIFKI